MSAKMYQRTSIWVATNGFVERSRKIRNIEISIVLISQCLQFLIVRDLERGRLVMHHSGKLRLLTLAHLAS